MTYGRVGLVSIVTRGGPSEYLSLLQGGSVMGCLHWLLSVSVAIVVGFMVEAMIGFSSFGVVGLLAMLFTIKGYDKLFRKNKEEAPLDCESIGHSYGGQYCTRCGAEL
jgi:hypothetical protein